jgi:hypothetical protein
MLIYLTIFFAITVNFYESCSSNNAYFPENGASALAILKGSLNGSPVQGTITFTQAVK